MTKKVAAVAAISAVMKMKVAAEATANNHITFKNLKTCPFEHYAKKVGFLLSRGRSLHR